jgi:DNA-binding transcriptional MerR regulator
MPAPAAVPPEQPLADDVDDAPVDAPAADDRGAADDAGSPEKSPGAYRTISEVSVELGVAQHVLRFWESKFREVRPLKRAGGRRYYRPSDIDLLRRVKVWLYDEGLTIKGVQKRLRGPRLREPFAGAAGGAPPGRERPAPAAPEAALRPTASRSDKGVLRQVLQELRAIRRELGP